MKKLRISSAVLLTRTRDGELELLLVRRAKTLRFFGGYWALPGGVIDPSDHDGDVESDAAHRRCALRELFEETGVLPADLAAELDPAQRTRLRAALLANEGGAEFRALLDEHPAALALPRAFARLTTPPFGPLRYRTRFLHLELPAGEEPEILEGELTDGSFARPADCIDSWLRGERLIVPPVLDFLRRLRGQPLGAFFEEIADVTRALDGGWLTEVRNTPGVWMLPLATPTIPPATTTNCYIVGNARLFVIDPATYEAGERRRLFEFLEQRRSEGREIAGVVATHHHQDHVGSIGPVAERYGVPVYAHPRTLERLPAGFDESRPLNDGDTLDLGVAPDGRPGWKLRAYHTPGHDQGHLAFVENRYDAALVGDLCSTVSTIVIDPPEGHMATYLASLERMRSVPMGVLYPAHGPAARDGHAWIDHYLAHRAAREAKLVAALGPAPRAVRELLAEVYADVAPEVLGLAERSMLAGLEKLAEEARAEQVGEDWRCTVSHQNHRPASD